ncbi:MAG TPA: carboxypeptidase-like regulatory domain-containing protein [Pyrinomonadaceae bacterium]|nr:carboxypeptidase-like regulatory domain-containing protein [Pyrinomonadaceae bacterium]
MFYRTIRNLIFAFAFVLFAGLITASAQVASGGAYSLEQSVIAGGGTSSSGGSYSLEGTIGQSVAGTRSASDTPGSEYGLDPGFWQSSLVPTAAMVSVTGRVVTQDGRGIVGVRLTLVDPIGNTYQALSSSFGAFQFDGIASGQAYVLTVTSKRFQFQPQVLAVNDNVSDLKIVALQ